MKVFKGHKPPKKFNFRLQHWSRISCHSFSWGFFLHLLFNHNHNLIQYGSLHPCFHCRASQSTDKLNWPEIRAWILGNGNCSWQKQNTVPLLFLNKVCSKSCLRLESFGPKVHTNNNKKRLFRHPKKDILCERSFFSIHLLSLEQYHWGLKFHYYLKLCGQKKYLMASPIQQL